LIGAPGAGKSSALEALSTAWERDGVAHGAIESEQLSMGWPLLGPEVWTAALGDVLARWRAAGRERFLVAATTEDHAQLDAVRALLPDAFVVALAAPADVLGARLDAREPDVWPGKPGLIAHARALAETIPALPGVDLVIDTTDREARDVAREILAAALQRG
jgi:gluconate kinase